mmetsp:Transcript_62085/g.134756  ORF Transcript_62085/g.134756 Transcript_62085/m.134756 type:complete len:446 (+) Transcript_62085:94-1431(+)
MGSPREQHWGVSLWPVALLVVLVSLAFRERESALAKLSFATEDTRPVSAVARNDGADAEDEDIALFTHTNNELHCMDRELRHPCVRELRNFVEDKANADKRGAALSCVQEVLASSRDFYELKNMTHLLLDLDTVEHAFDRDSRDDDFVMSGVAFAEKLMSHPECLAEFDTKSELECRCVPLYAKVAILKLKNAKLLDRAKAVFDRISSMPWSGTTRTYAPGDAVPWDHFQHTPQIWVRGLRSQPVWPRETWGDLPICEKLEDNFETIREEAQQALLSPEGRFEDAYRFLYEKGEWNHVMLYHKREFTEACELAFPKTCALLKQWLPSKPGLPWTSDQNEQAMVIKMAKGTEVELHSGPANNILNIHIGISGLTGAKLIVANETYRWEEGKVIAWDGSYDHSVNCVECEQERVIMMVRYMHPDMAPEHYRGIRQTHFEEVPAELRG